MNTTEIEFEHSVVSRSEWLASRKALLEKEKEFTRLRDNLCAERRGLPWVKVGEDYAFDGPSGKVSLAALFGKNSQLIVYHFMFDPAWEEGCPGCSFLSDHVDSARQHFEQRDVSFVAISRAPVEKLESYRKRMGWKFTWVSSAENEFNYDYHVSFTEEQVASGEATYNYEPQTEAGECPGASVFYKDKHGDIFHTYSSYARGDEGTLGAFMWMDLTPKGRNEETTMDWIRRHDQYESPTSKCCH